MFKKTHILALAVAAGLAFYGAELTTAVSAEKKTEAAGQPAPPSAPPPHMMQGMQGGQGMGMPQGGGMMMPQGNMHGEMGMMGPGMMGPGMGPGMMPPPEGMPPEAMNDPAMQLQHISMQLQFLARQIEQLGAAVNHVGSRLAAPAGAEGADSAEQAPAEGKKPQTKEKKK